jgi:hypothetical protein
MVPRMTNFEKLAAAANIARGLANDIAPPEK